MFVLDLLSKRTYVFVVLCDDQKNQDKVKMIHKIKKQENQVPRQKIKSKIVAELDAAKVPNLTRQEVELDATKNVPNLTRQEVELDAT